MASISDTIGHLFTSSSDDSNDPLSRNTFDSQTLHLRWRNSGESGKQQSTEIENTMQKTTGWFNFNTIVIDYMDTDRHAMKVPQS